MYFNSSDIIDKTDEPRIQNKLALSRFIPNFSLLKNRFEVSDFSLFHIQLFHLSTQIKYETINKISTKFLNKVRKSTQCCGLSTIQVPGLTKVFLFHDFYQTPAHLVHTMNSLQKHGYNVYCPFINFDLTKVQNSISLKDRIGYLIHIITQNQPYVVVCQGFSANFCLSIVQNDVNCKHILLFNPQFQVKEVVVRPVDLECNYQCSTICEDDSIVAHQTKDNHMSLQINASRNQSIGEKQSIQQFELCLPNDSIEMNQEPFSFKITQVDVSTTQSQYFRVFDKVLFENTLLFKELQIAADITCYRNIRQYKPAHVQQIILGDMSSIIGVAPKFYYQLLQENNDYYKTVLFQDTLDILCKQALCPLILCFPRKLTILSSEFSPFPRSIECFVDLRFSHNAHLLFLEDSCHDVIGSQPEVIFQLLK